MDSFQSKFKEEATDLIAELEQSLLNLEQDMDNPTIVDSVFRVMHSLKGGGGMFGFDNISTYTHKLENLYDLIRQKKIRVTREILDITFESADHITSMLNDEGSLTEQIKKNEVILLERINKVLNQKDDSPQEEEVSSVQDDSAMVSYHIQIKPYEHISNNGTNPFYLIDDLVGLGKHLVQIFPNGIPELENLNVKDTHISWEVILATDKGIDAIKDVFIFVEGDCDVNIVELVKGDIFTFENINPLLVARDGFGFDVDKIKQFTHNLLALQQSKQKDVPQTKEGEHLKKFTKESAISGIRVSSEKIDQLMNLVSELITTQASLNLYADNNKSNELTRITENLENISRQLRDTAFSISLIPIDYLVVRFKRLVRDLSREVNKEIDFEAQGSETELDKSLIEGLSEPLMHILRNSMDHGIESAEERIKKGKNPKGKILLQAYYSGSQVIIAISDDGRGMSPQKIRKKAIEKGLITPETQLSDKEILDLVFVPGFSTSDKVTNISGRGVGMDVVKRKISDIRGTVGISSVVDEGTTITIKLPLTLSIIDGMLVKIADTEFIIPLSVIDTIFAINHDDIDKSYNNLMIIEGTQYPFYYLREEFGFDKDSAPKQEEMIIVKYEDKRIGMIVDYITGEYQAVLKPLGRLYHNQDVFSGASILGDGTVALVLDTHKVVQRFTKYND